ncbi:MAG TPA: hypothetical protein PKD85_02260 [Saprospiraceae bacterium]|nr:hypothetical protein [Saprospiraceae bacterium]
MKKLILVTMLVGLYNFCFAQIEFGVKAGLSSFDLAARGIDFNQGKSYYKLQFRNAEYGHHLGAYARATLLGVFIEPSLIFNSSRINYTLDEYSERGIFDKVLSERYYNMSLPVVAGVKLGLFRLYGGPVANIHLAKTSDLWDINGYSDKIKTATYGYQAGVGINVWKLRFDLGYEGNLSNFGDHINIDGVRYTFDEKASRVLDYGLQVIVHK